MAGGVDIGAMAPGQGPAVAALLRAAFDGPAEADLVARLRAAGDMALELVAAGPDGVAGYLALSRMQAPAGWLALAPVAVAPDRQRRGIGAALVRAGLARLPGRFVVVLGDPAYYGRLGFSRDRARRLTSPYPLSHMLLAGPGRQAPEAALAYPPAFDG